MTAANLFHPLASAIFWIIAMTFAKLIDLSSEGRIGRLASKVASSVLLIYAFNLIILCLLVFFNTLSIKHNMISFKYNGSFLGQVYLIVFCWVLSTIIAAMFDNKNIKLIRVLGCLMIIAGILLIYFDNRKHYAPPNPTSGALGYSEIEEIKNMESLGLPVEEVNSSGLTNPFENTGKAELNPVNNLNTKPQQ